jgi:protein phosphatase
MTENNFQIDSASVSDRGLSKKRPNNEDSYLELNQRGLFAVADGVGGAQAGDVASQMAMEILGEAFNNLKPNEDAEEMMKIAIERANSAIYQMSQDLPQLATMATTVVALHLSGNIGTIGHAGDSRLYRLDENGNLYRETNDHSVVEEEVRAGRMTVAQAANHPSRNVISRALGADNTVDVDMKTIMFEPNTTFLLCSDGITRHIDDFELRELLASNDAPAQICQKMKDICYERGAEDNLTAVIARVSNIVAGNIFQKPNQIVNTLEEATVAAARTSSDFATEHSNILELDDEFQTQELKMPAAKNLPPIELEVSPTPRTNQQIIPEPAPIAKVQEEVKVTPPVYDFQEDVSYTEPEEVIEEKVEEPKIIEKTKAIETPAPQPLPPSVKEVENKPYEVENVEGNNFLSKALLGIFTFLIGLIIGAGAIYVFMQPMAQTAVAPVLPEKSANPPQSLFEDSRRKLDANPLPYIVELEKNDNKNSEDYFLLGRGYMLTGKYPEAKKAFEEAKNKLGETDIENADVIANDVAAYLAIIENTNAQKVFQDEIKKAKVVSESQTNGAEANMNTNTGAGN